MSSRLRSLLAAVNLSEGHLKTFLEEVAASLGGSGPALSNAPPQDVGVTSPGVSPDASRGDHAHAHGNQAGGSLHALASPNPGGLAGFLSPVDKTKLDALPGSFVESFNLRTGIVAPQAGDYTAGQVGADPAGTAAAVGAAIVGTIGQPGGIAALNASSEISDATHGARSGGALHAVATTLLAGFLSAADKARLDGLPSLSNAAPANVGTTAPGVGLEASRADHVHAHGNQLGGTLHADATTLLAGFMSAADKTKLDGLTPTVNAGTGWLYGLGFDGARVVPTGIAPILTTPVNYTDLTMDPGAILPASAQPIDVSGTLTFGAGSVIHVDGNNAVGTTGGAATVAGSLAQAGIAGAGGGIGNSVGGNAIAQGTPSTALGGNGGAGGGGGGGQPGGTGGVVVRPVAATVGRWEQDRGIFFNYTTSGFTRPRGGANGGGGGGSVNGSGGGGGSGASVGQVRARRIVVLAGATNCFRARGGDGASVAVALSGGGGAGGGGSIDVFCDEIELAVGIAYADLFNVSGGIGGTAITVGNAGGNGVAGRGRLYLRGVLVYQTPLHRDGEGSSGASQLLVAA
jgi:hypothetical protein